MTIGYHFSNLIISALILDDAFDLAKNHYMVATSWFRFIIDQYSSQIYAKTQIYDYFLIKFHHSLRTEPAK